jgi:iron complex outermembrane receptor protein
MTRLRLLALTCSLLALAGVGLAASPAAAQPGAAAAQPNQLTEIIVTARKRQESILNVPIVETALPQQQLERMQTKDLKGIATLVPGLAIGDNLLSIGTTISIRGVGTSAYDPGVDQAVSLNIDGMQFSQGLAYTSGMFDMGQVEVLKGPQSLFYGKSSPGGVISVRTADPTDRFELIGRVGHEFEANEWQGDIIVSGPVTDTLKLRFATTFGHQDGYYKNAATGLAATGALNPAHSRIGPDKHYQLRGTALWTPTKEFDARLKINQVYDHDTYAGTEQYVLCPDGVTSPIGIPFLGGNENCKRDRTVNLVDYNPAAFPGVPNGGTPFLENTQTYGTLEMNYRIQPELTLTSVTGYYTIHSQSLVNTTQTTFAAPFASVTNHFKRHDWSEELRLNSDYVGPVNFTLGGLIQRTGVGDLVTLGGNTFLSFPAFLIKGTNELDEKTNSVFGQVRWKVIPKVEVAAGARWTSERRSDDPFAYDAANNRTPTLIPTPKIKSDKAAPELTVTYKPTDDWTVFGSVKKGYKSGSYDIATAATANMENSFRDEKVQGFEVGAKARLLDRRLVTNLAFYDYHYSDLQIGGISPLAGIPTIITVNAGSALVYGIDYDVTYRPAMVDGLTLRGAVNWNEAHFQAFQNAAPCYGGQLISEGCNEVFSPALGVFLAQDWSGKPMIRAPKWQVNAGADYETGIGNDRKLVLSANSQFSSKYNTNLGFLYYQKSFLKTDLSATIQGPRDRWEFSIIGKNISDERTAGTCNNFNASIGGPFVAGELPGGTGTNTPAVYGHDEVGCFMDRGREFWLRLTVKPFA